MPALLLLPLLLPLLLLLMQMPLQPPAACCKDSRSFRSPADTDERR
jgi:hypothetical protein